MYNPDYPIASGAGFIQHTYKPSEQQHQNEYFYYNGMGAVNPFDNNNTMAYSRRNMGYPQQQYGCYGAPMSMPMPMSAQPNFSNNQTIPEANVVPFGTYPPVPTATAGVPAFNALVESRRNASAVANCSNPWATNQQQIPTAVAQPTQTMPTQTMPTQQASYFNQYCADFRNPNAAIEMNASALYGNGLTCFDRKSGCWENNYTAGRTIPTPAVDWRASTAENQYQSQMYFPAAQYPKTNTSWSEIAKNNWSNCNI